MDRRVHSGILAAALVTALAVPAAASPHEDQGMLAAVQRHLGVTEDQAIARLAAEQRASETDRELRKELGDRYAGGWLTRDGTTLVVGVTDDAAADSVRAGGAEPRLVEHSESELDAVRSTLDAQRTRAPKTTASWYVDVTTNAVVVNARAVDAAWRFVRASGADTSAVRVVRSDESPRPLIDVVGGNAYYIGAGTRCSVGFSVNGGFVTAGHCGRAGSPTAGSNWVAQGTFRGSSFPTNDYAWVETNGSWNTLPNVNNYAGGSVNVTGSQVAGVGSSVCRSGRTTGWRCGTVQALNVTINYAQGPVYEATQTSACAEGGDSGGSFISGSQAQGVTSGGSGNCSFGGTTFFQPVNETLSRYGLTLVTG